MMAAETDNPKGLSDRRREAAMAGHGGDVAAAQVLAHDTDPTVRAIALGALARLGSLSSDLLQRGATDESAIVRRRAAELAGQPGSGFSLLLLLDDADPTVVEVAAWAAGEQVAVEDDVLDRLIELAVTHPETLVRESAVAALGAIGDQRGLAAILHGCADKPAIRRRAVLALAPFDGPEVDAAIAQAEQDRDWQVRQSVLVLTRARDLGAGYLEPT